MSGIDREAEQYIKVAGPLLNKPKGGNEPEQYFKVNGNEDINELLVNNKINVKKEEEEKEKEKREKRKKRKKEMKKRNKERKIRKGRKMKIEYYYPYRP